MKKVLLASVALIALTAADSANAAYMPVAPPPVYAAPAQAAWSWAGFYLGVHGGYGWGDGPFTDTISQGPPPVILPGIKSRGYVLGGHAGYNWQYGMVVGGLEVDMSATGIKGSTSGTATSGAPPFTTTITDTRAKKFDYLGTARARIGFLPWQNLLLYGTGGLGWTRLTLDN